MSLIVPAATAAATTATLWFVPLIVAAVSFYQYDKTDPEGRPKDTKVNQTTSPKITHTFVVLFKTADFLFLAELKICRQLNDVISQHLILSPP